jgi:predicted Zn finger-like uncharacterized protein
MPITIYCPSCGQHYQVADNTAGQSVRCQKCGSHFQAMPPPGSVTGGMNPRAAGHAWNARLDANTGRASVSNPSGGPTDGQMRLGACGALALALLLVVGSLILNAATGSVYLFVTGLVPLLLVLGITVLISPDVIRACGQYGKHLPGHYKWIGRGLLGFSILLMFPLMILLYRAGYRTNVPRPRPQFQGANSAQAPQAPPIANPQPAQGELPVGGGGPAAQAASGGMKPRKAYPVTIAVPEHSAIVPASGTIPPGTRLEACWAGKWNPTTTLSANDDGSLNVRWDAFGPDFDCSMVRDELIIRKDAARQLGINIEASESSPPATSAAKPAGGDARPKPLKSYPVTIAVPADSQAVPADAKLPPGTRLQACWAGKWNPITLLSENDDGTLTVRWDDFGPTYDCRMTREELIVKTDALR